MISTRMLASVLAAALLAGGGWTTEWQATSSSAVGAALPDSLVKRPLGSLVPVRSLRRRLNADLGRWIRQWERIAPGFGKGSVWLDSTRSFRPYLQPLDPALRDTRRGEFWSPDRSRYLNPDRYVDVRMDGRKLEIVNDVDSAPVVADLSTDMLMTLRFCGPACSFYDGWWIDGSRCAVAGISSEYDDLRGSRGTLDVYDLDRRTVIHVTTTRSMSEQEGRRFGRLSRELLRRRFSGTSARAR